MAKKIVPKYEPEVARAKIGRPSAYHKEYAEQALHLCRLGATDHDLALAFHASVSMIKRWAATHAEFRAALKVGKEAADQRVERSLYQRAVGYSFDSVKIFMPAGAKKPLYAPYVEQRAARRRRVLTSSSRSCRCLDHSRCRMRGMNTTAVYGRYCVPKRRFADRVLVIGRLI